MKTNWKKYFAISFGACALTIGAMQTIDIIAKISLIAIGTLLIIIGMREKATHQ